MTSTFQSTRPRGARPDCIARDNGEAQVSIHAPAWGATSVMGACTSSGGGFNPRARVGRDRMRTLTGWLMPSFNPRARVGRDAQDAGQRLAHGCFNPRARVGRDTRLLADCLRFAGFQSTRPRGARPCPTFWPGPPSSFNPRARVGRDACSGGRYDAQWRFQSTRPRGARRGSGVHPIQDRLFQSTRPRGARREFGRQGDFHLPFQSTRPRGARPDLVDARKNSIRVSIHAPAWGATLDDVQILAAVSEFQSTRPRGARRRQTRPHAARTMFQSTRPRGARRIDARLRRALSGVSIHAPAWGATRLTGVWARGCYGFQSTRPRGARHGNGRVDRARMPGFNPRARVGRDRELRRTPIADLLFQSTRPRGARRQAHGLLPGDRPVSIHAPAWGATGPGHPKSGAQRCFNPRARVGRDLAPPPWPTSKSQFQSTRPRGARRNAIEAYKGFLFVSIHAPAWGATGRRTERTRSSSGFNPRARVGRDRPWRPRLQRCRSFNPRARVGRDIALLYTVL